MANIENLKPITNSEDAKRLGSLGGKASAKSKKKKKTMKQALDLLLSLPVSEQNRIALENLGVEGSDANNLMLMMTSLMQNAMAGDVKAISLIVELTSAKPISAQEKAKMALEKKRIDLEERRLKLKEEPGEVDDGVVIINDV